MFLQLSGFTPEFEALAKVTPVGPRGTSMLELKDAARRLGATVVVSSMTREQLIAAPKPVIAYCDESQLAQSEELATGHYVVVIDASPAEVHSLDGSTGRLRVNSWARFEMRWHGYVLITESETDICEEWMRLASFAAAAVVALALVLRRGGVNHVPARPSRAGGG
jgi:ABC-type bacteriocin/lantibiotic exporter with double-glycine peptidase domain